MDKVEEIILRLKEIEGIARPLVEERIEEFKRLGRYGSEEELFSELSFCVLTANWSANGGIKAQKEIGEEGFINLSQEELAERLARLGHRFPYKRAEFIVENRRLIGNIREIIALDVYKARRLLVEGAKGIGWKEASHFLRNIGKLEVAILDRHILKILREAGLIEDLPKGWTEKRYLSIEESFIELSNSFGRLPGETDLYLWYLIKRKVEK